MELGITTLARPRLLPLADALGILVFATVGLLSHDHALSLSGYARDALPLLAGWFAAALVFGAYRAPSARTPAAAPAKPAPPLLGRLRRAYGSTLLVTWIVGVPLGWLIRALALGRDLDGGQVVFLVISLVFTLLFVVACRAAFGLLIPGRARP
jgi:hypothetical protein